MATYLRIVRDCLAMAAEGAAQWRSNNTPWGVGFSLNQVTLIRVGSAIQVSQIIPLLGWGVTPQPFAAEGRGKE
jgi:hypothetical protein